MANRVRLQLALPTCCAKFPIGFFRFGRLFACGMTSLATVRSTASCRCSGRSGHEATAIDPDQNWQAVGRILRIAVVDEVVRVRLFAIRVL